MKKTELLSPAGDFECLTAALRCGADAVYIGEKSFSARKGAKNFTWQEIETAARLCRIRGVKLYLALNTLVRPGEERQMAHAVKMAAETGVDALIIQDLGAAEIARQVCPSLPRHASTQLSAHSAADVRSLTELGFSRVVLSRELSRGEISKIYAETGCEFEAFVHGALCICFSGRCLMSSFIGGRSGNRGCCAQPCRQLYQAQGRRGYFLSPRDLSLLRDLEDMKRAGIVSFKIEGRMKSPEYVALVTSIYRKALDGEPITAEDEADLRGIFSRGGEFTRGYFAGINTPEMMNYSLSNDGLSTSAPKELMTKARALYTQGVEKPRIGVKMELICRENEPLRLTATDGEFTAKAEGALPQRAENAPVTAAKAAERLGKTGGTPYYLSDFSADVGEGLFVPASELNSLRRDCFNALDDMRGKVSKREVHEFGLVPAVNRSVGKQLVYAEISSIDQLGAAEAADLVIVPLKLLDDVPFKDNYAAALPQIILDGDTVRERLSRLPRGAQVYSSTIGGLRLISEAGLTPVGDYGLNVSNSCAAAVLASSAVRLTLSPELNLKEIKSITDEMPLPAEVIAYGRQRVMVSRACLIRGARGKCDCEAPLALRDKTGAEFTVMGDRETHLNTVLNSRPTFMADKLPQLRRCGAAAIRLCFTLEAPQSVRDIISMYRHGGNAEGEFTRGYFFKDK